MTIEEMKAKKREIGYTNADLAELSGLPLSTVNKILSGATKAPRRESIAALESVFRSVPKAPSTINFYGQGSASADVFSDNTSEYCAGTSAIKKRQGEYTLEDYLALPDDVRVELIDGVFYDMASPTTTHQFIIVQVLHQLMQYVDEKKGPCKPVMSSDVQIFKDDRNVVQPDILILCKPEDLIKNGRVFGSPDFVAEVLSPSNRKMDLFKKLAIYSDADVREYWIIDPKNKTVTVYDFEHEIPGKTYEFTDKIPVSIWNGEFCIDFNQVYEYVKDYLD